MLISVLDNSPKEKDLIPYAVNVNTPVSASLFCLQHNCGTERFFNFLILYFYIKMCFVWTCSGNRNGSSENPSYLRADLMCMHRKYKHCNQTEINLVFGGYSRIGP